MKYIVILILFITTESSHALDFRQYPALVNLVNTMTSQDGYPYDELVEILGNARIDKSIIRSMNRQYEALPWHKYRNLFINQDRIHKGVDYWNKHEIILNRATREYGVPASVIVALIGVETHFGTRMGNKRVLDALVTLTADYPRRSEFFGSELRIFLNTTHKEDIAAESVTGSFAGAIGIPQFMPSSYEAYAVDFNGNVKRDLVNEIDDAIGSVANYLKTHGWIKGQAIFVSLAGQIPQSAKEMVSKRAKPKLSADQIKASGVVFNTRGGSDKMALLRLQEEQDYRYIIGFRNFYAITRYNPSVNYAMAVTELSQQISSQRAQ